MSAETFLAVTASGRYIYVGERLSFGPGGKSPTISTTTEIDRATVQPMAVWHKCADLYDHDNDEPVNYLPAKASRTVRLVPPADVLGPPVTKQ